jgi:hypothetical protein
MVQKRTITESEALNEEPVLLLIVSEGGRPLFSQSFSEDNSFEDHLFGGFFTAINSFITEKFSEGLDRAIFGEHTLLMNSISPFFMCYVFKGQSYLADQKVKKFIDNITKDDKVWNKLKEFNESNQLIQPNDFPSLDSLISEIFTQNSFQLA